MNEPIEKSSPSQCQIQEAWDVDGQGGAFEILEDSCYIEKIIVAFDFFIDLTGLETNICHSKNIG